MKVYEVSQPWGGTFLHCGYCWGWEVANDMLKLREPFVRFHLFSDKGMVDCRGAWRLGDWLPADFYQVTTATYQPWMDLDMVDVLVAMDLCAECHVTLPDAGYSRLTIL